MQVLIQLLIQLLTQLSITTIDVRQDYFVFAPVLNFASSNSEFVNLKWAEILSGKPQSVYTRPSSLFSLNILAVRRHIVADIRGVLSDSEEDYPDDAPPEEEVAPLSYQKLVRASEFTPGNLSQFTHY